MTNTRFPRPTDGMSPVARPAAWHRTLEVHGNACVCGQSVAGIQCWEPKR